MSLARRLIDFSGDLRGKDRCMLVNAESAQMVCCRLYGLHTAIHSYVPQLDFSASTAAHELSLTAALQVYICNPLLVFFPDLDHGSCRFLALVVHTNGTITETSNEDIAFDLVRCQRGDARTRSSRYIL